MLVPLNRNPFDLQPLLIFSKLLSHSLALASQSSLVSQKAKSIPAFQMQRWRPSKVKRFAQGHLVGEEKDSQSKDKDIQVLVPSCVLLPLQWPGLLRPLPSRPGSVSREVTMKAPAYQGPISYFCTPWGTHFHGPKVVDFTRIKPRVPSPPDREQPVPAGPSPSLENSSCGESPQTALGLFRLSLCDESGLSG